MAYPSAVNVYIDFDNGPFAGTFTWTDVTPWVIGRVQFGYGRSSVVDEFQPGQGSILLNNSDSRFDPSNASGPYYGKLKQRRRLRVTAFNNGTLRQFISGWIEGFTQTKTPRGQAQTEVRFYDAFSLLARQPMPQSVYDWMVGTTLKTAVHTWYRLDPDYWQEVDGSGNNRDGVWRIWEGNNMPPWVGNFMPDAILQSSKAGTVIPASGRNGMNWALAQSQVGQPLGGISGTPRTPSLVCHDDTAGLTQGDFTAETWIQFRQAFPLGLNNVVASNTPIRQPIITWGPYGGAQWTWGIDSSGHPQVLVSTLTGSLAGLSASTTIADASVHHLVFTHTYSTHVVGMWLDGVNLANVDISAYPAPFSWPAVIGYASPDGFSSLQSTLGDVIFYNRRLTTAEIGKNYYAGKYGTTNGSSTTLTTATAPSQMLQVGGAPLPVLIDIGAGQTIDPGKLGSLSCLDVIRKIAASEQGMLYWEPTWTFRVMQRDWRTISYAATSQYALTDGPVGGGAGVNVLYSDNTPVKYSDNTNVQYTGGTPTSYGYFDTKWVSGVDRLANDVTVRYSVGSKKPGDARMGEQRVQNAASITDYGAVRAQIDTLLTDGSQALQTANYRVWLNGDVTALATDTHLDEVTIYPNVPTEFDLVLKVVPGYRLTITATRGNGSTFTADYHVQRIRHDFSVESGGEWKTTLGLIRADWPAKQFIVGTSSYDGPDVIWW